MKNLKRRTFHAAYAIICITLILSCGGDDNPPLPIDCEGADFSACLTGGSQKIWSPATSGGSPITDECVTSIQITFGANGSFSFFSRDECTETTNYDGTWEVNEDNTEIHITPPWFPQESLTILEIVSFTESTLTAVTPTDVGRQTIGWRSL